MKKILLFAGCLLLCRMANAQKSLLSLDEHNKYIYYQVVDIPGVSTDSLLKNGAYFVEGAYPKIKLKELNVKNITVKDKFSTYSTTAFVKHDNGQINYTLTIECKDSKYRYWLTDFTFTPFERDRYGDFVAKASINIPLETATNKIDKKELDGYLDQTGTFCKDIAVKLKQYMAGNHGPQKTDHQPPKIVTDKW
jgi:Domain of unknown function (DUF4468) with TBP-like fold